VLQVLPGESGEYDIVYSLPKEGQYRMWIRIYGTDIQDSPFQVIKDCFSLSYIDDDLHLDNLSSQ
jgi:hypothetical protein